MSAADFGVFREFVQRGQAAQRAVDAIAETLARPRWTPLTRPQMLAMRRLLQMRAFTAADPVSHTMIAVELVTLRSLMRKGYVERSTAPGVARWYLTPAGRTRAQGV